MNAYPRPTMEQQLSAAQTENESLTAALNSVFELLQQDEQWQKRALALIRRQTRALRQTTHVLASHDLGITEAGIPPLNEALLSEVDAFLDEYQEADR